METTATQVPNTRTSKKKGKEKIRSKGEKKEKSIKKEKVDKNFSPEKSHKRKAPENSEKPHKKKRRSNEEQFVKELSTTDSKKTKKSKKKKKEKEHPSTSLKIKSEEHDDKNPFSFTVPTEQTSLLKQPSNEIEVKISKKDKKKEKKDKKHKKKQKREKEKSLQQEEGSQGNVKVKSKSPKKKKSNSSKDPENEEVGEPFDTKSPLDSVLEPTNSANSKKNSPRNNDNKHKNDVSKIQSAIVSKETSSSGLVPIPPESQPQQKTSISSSPKTQKAVTIPIPGTAAEPTNSAARPKKTTPIAVPSTNSVSKKKRPLTPAIIPDDSDEEFTPEILEGKKNKTKLSEKLKLPPMCGGTVFLEETPEEAAQRIAEYEDFKRKRQEAVGFTGKIEFNSDGVSLIQEKWTDSKEFQMLEASGYAVRKGKFSKEEDEVITKAVENYLMEHGEGVELIQRILFGDKSQKSKEESKLLCQEIGKVVPDRPLNAVYLRLRRRYHPDNYGGPFTPEQEAKLHQLVLMHGKDWKKIGALIGREPSSCRDRWRFYKMTPYKAGSWSAEEDERLKQIVYSMTVDVGRPTVRDISWEVVATKMGDRNARQCRIRWYESLNMQLKELPSEEEGLANTREFLKRVYESNARNESEIQWRKLIDDEWNPWNPRFMQQTWRKLKALIPEVKTMTFDQILHYLIRQTDKHIQQLSIHQAKESSLPQQ